MDGRPEAFLSQVDRLRIERFTRDGETFATTAATVSCSVKSIQRYTGAFRE